VEDAQLNILFLAIPIAIVLGTSLFMGFLWSVKSGQLDDLETPAHRLLIDNEKFGNDKNEVNDIKETNVKETT
jgi:cbb3-type cytochrome oxidase maturation protein